MGRSIRRSNVFKADRPFIFMIYDFDGNIPLFAGKLVDPSNSVITREQDTNDGWIDIM